MEIQDSLKILLEFKDVNPYRFDINQIVTVTISSIFAIILAMITAKLTRKKELDKVKEESRALQKSINQTLLTIESENYRNLHEYRLNALKRIKGISFDLLETNKENYGCWGEFLQDFPFLKLRELLHDYIIDYSHVLNPQTASIIKEAYFDCEHASNNYSPMDDSYYQHANRVYEKIKEFIVALDNDMEIDIQRVAQKIENIQPPK